MDAEVDFCRRCQSLPSELQPWQRTPLSSQKAHTAQRSGPSQPSHHPQVMLPQMQQGLAPRLLIECWWSAIIASEYASRAPLLKARDPHLRFLAFKPGFSSMNSWPLRRTSARSTLSNGTCFAIWSRGGVTDRGA